jgi:hypothetical protein
MYIYVYTYMYKYKYIYIHIYINLALKGSLLEPSLSPAEFLGKTDIMIK